MLNELVIVERGARQAGVAMAQRHPDLKDARRVPTLLVMLDSESQVASVRPVPSEITPWTLRDGQHNSFPFVQPKQPLWLLTADDERRRAILNKKNANRREAIVDLAAIAQFNELPFREWPGDGLLKRLRERRGQLASLEGAEAAAVPASIDRFVRACDASDGGSPQRLLQGIAGTLVAGLRQSSGSDWIEVAAAILIEGNGGFIFDAAGDWPSVLDAKVVAGVSAALRTGATNDASGQNQGHCALTGERQQLVESKFPQPNLPFLGQTYLFARNKDAPANDRYGQFSADAMPVGQETVIRLAAAIEALTTEERRGVTWRPVPGEAPKQMDLLLAFVDGVSDAPAAGAMADDGEEDDFSEESPDVSQDASVDSIAQFEKRTERVIDTVKAKTGGDLSPLVHVAILRKIDPANRKVVYAGRPTVSELYKAAMDWARGERNVPPWFALHTFRPGVRKPRLMTPPHVAPLGLITFSRQFYRRGGIEQQEVVGLSAAEVFGLFFGAPNERRGRLRIRRVLRLILARREILVAGFAHAVRRGLDTTKKFKRSEVLRTVTMLGVLLDKLGRTKETYMSDAAFKLGQLLAAADVVHVGYCADIRDGKVPPSLLGNQVFSMAQLAPQRALAALGRRWKPYEGWMRRAARDRGRADALIASKKPDDIRRGWDIRKAVRCAHELPSLAQELETALADCIVNDQFRAELLLGYVAGLPKAPKDDVASTSQNTQDNQEED
jgi:hypothetical protein